MLRSGVAICPVLAIVAPGIYAAQLSVDLDASKTQVAFVISDTLHTARGNFRLKEGHVLVDPETNAISGGIVVDASSGNSGSKVRDKRMTRDILQAERFPEIRFNPNHWTGSISETGDSDIQVSGAFLIHGQEHPITIPIHVRRISQSDVIATGKFLVPYVEWGMKNPSNFLIKVNDKVEIDLAAVGHIKDPASARSVPRPPPVPEQ